MGEVRGKDVDGRYPGLEVGRRSGCLQAHDTLLETGTPGRVEDRTLPPMEREPEQSNTGRKAGSMQDDGQDEQHAHPHVYMEEDGDEGREAKDGRMPRRGVEHEHENKGDPAWRRLSRRTIAGNLRRPYEKETSTEARSGG